MDPGGEGSKPALADDWPAKVLSFWFETLNAEDWFSGESRIDADVRERFRSLHEALQANPPVAKSMDARTLLATVLVFDQFSRNLFRGTVAAFSGDGEALQLARHAVATGLDLTLGLDERKFIYMPFMHSEDPDDQTRSVELFTALGDAEQLHWAKHHRALIDRFGRFPQRNEALGRTSTPQELAFLASLGES